MMCAPILLFVATATPPAAAAPPPIVPRTSWDSRVAVSAPPALPAVTHYQKSLATVLDGIVVHHSDFIDAPGPLGILDYHLDVAGFSDIGYHFVIDDEGVIYEGRPLDALGAHAGQSLEANAAVRAARKAGGPRRRANIDKARRLDPDYGAIGIVLDGYFHDRAPPRVQVDALTRLVTHLRARYRIARDAVIAHREVRQRRVIDRGLTFTGPVSICPGDAAYRWFLLWRGSLPSDPASEN